MSLESSSSNSWSFDSSGNCNQAPPPIGVVAELVGRFPETIDAKGHVCIPIVFCNEQFMLALAVNIYQAVEDCAPELCSSMSMEQFASFHLESGFCPAAGTIVVCIKDTGASSFGKGFVAATFRNQTVSSAVIASMATSEFTKGLFDLVKNTTNPTSDEHQP